MKDKKQNLLIEDQDWHYLADNGFSNQVMQAIIYRQRFRRLVIMLAALTGVGCGMGVMLTMGVAWPEEWLGVDEWLAHFRFLALLTVCVSLFLIVRSERLGDPSQR